MRDVRFLELHTELFHAGKNFTKKLQPTGIHKGLKLVWDPKEKWFEATWEGRTGYILPSNVAFWEPNEGPAVHLPVNEHKTESIEGRRRAQVSTPMGHVFEGEGHGKTGKLK